jgi:hypothetical protein
MTNLTYSVPQQSQQLFQKGIVENPLILKHAPKDIDGYASKIRFEGNHSPTIPINWRFAESVSALKAFEAVMILALLKRKYSVEAEKVLINT